jgi:hypothetical protein
MLDRINEAIKAKGHDWIAKENKMPTLKGLIISEEMKLTDPEKAAQLKIEGHRFVGTPVSFDLRNATINGKTGNWTTKIKNQANCGSCVAFGSCKTMEVAYKVISGDPSTVIDLSEADLFFNGCGQCCGSGWTLEAANNRLQSVGVCKEECYPYPDGPELQCCKANRMKIAGTVRVTSDAQAKERISNGFAIQFAMDVYEDYEYYSSGVYHYDYGGFMGGHCQCIVGYDDTRQCWLVGNSWTEEWGESGWAEIGYGECGIFRNYAGYAYQIAPPLPQTGVVINTTGSLGANVIDQATGIAIGKTDAGIALAPGNYTVILRKTGYIDYPLSFQVVDKMITTLSVTMTPVKPQGDFQVAMNCMLGIAKFTVGNLIGDKVLSLDVNGLNAGNIKNMPTLKSVILKDGANAKIFKNGDWVSFNLKRTNGTLVPHNVTKIPYGTGWIIALNGGTGTNHPYTFIVKEMATSEMVDYIDLADVAATMFAMSEGYEIEEVEE